MQETTNYKLKKLELTDSPADITVLNFNWDTIDTQLKTQADDITELENKKYDKTGGEISGKVTITAGGLEVTGDAALKNNVSIDGILSMANPIRSTKAEFLQTQAPVSKGTAPASTVYNYWSVFDQDGWSVSANRLAHIDYSVANNKTAALGLYVNKYEAGSTETPLGIVMQWAQGETPQIMLTQSPPAESNDKSIATTEWIQQNSPKTQLVRW